VKVDPSDAQVERAGIPCKSRSQRRRVCGFVCLGRECLYRYSVVCTPYWLCTVMSSVAKS